MADELERSRLDVVLVPAKYGNRMERVVQSENPAWYQRFCAKYASGRKDASLWREHKTSIKRQATLQALRAIATGKTASRPNQFSHDGGYIPMLLPFVEVELVKRRAEDAQVQRDIDQDRAQAIVPF